MSTRRSPRIALLPGAKSKETDDDATCAPPPARTKQSARSSQSARRSPRIALLPGAKSKETDCDDDDPTCAPPPASTKPSPTATVTATKPTRLIFDVNDGWMSLSNSDSLNLPEYQSKSYLRKRGSIKLMPIAPDLEANEILYVLIGEKMNGKKVVGAGRIGRLASQRKLILFTDQYYNFLVGSRTAQCPESLKGVKPKTLRFFAVANIYHRFSNNFKDITCTSDSPIKTEEQVRLILIDSMRRDFTLYNQNKCLGELQPIVDGITYQINIPLLGGRRKQTLQQLYRGAHDLSLKSLKSYLSIKIGKARSGIKMGELGVAILAYDNLGAEEKDIIGPISIRKVDSFHQKKSYDFAGFALMEREAINELRKNLLRNEMCLNIRIPGQTPEGIAAGDTKRNTERKLMTDKSAKKRQEKYDKLPLEDRTLFTKKNGYKYSPKTSRRTYTDDEKVAVMDSIKKVNGFSKLSERNFTMVAKHLVEKSRKRGPDEDVAAQSVVKRFAGSGEERSKKEESLNGLLIGSNVRWWRKMEKTEKEKDNWTIQKKRA
ncbi:hypothetical protein TrRE_jg8956 [Triparma retinervis]|uniref:Uncharacterized protein n=1 Tax=Triparma retinervis TaxID=2557542 RepID=A0A9W7AH30_9STRA|nr:hypothetical protein TrRE_jg8956 [Triparma retinervis]